MATLRLNGDAVGEVTSGGYGYRADASIALGVVQAEAAVPGTDLTVEIFGQSYRATVQPDAPLWDSENTRIRAQEV